MNQSEQLSFIDLLSIMSFCIGLMNLDINITQEDVDNQTQTILNELHGHLEIQDDKLDNIISRLEKLENGQN
jgi:division protein CdvB (Snf7/Vps24/ESCRT-III family)